MAEPDVVLTDGVVTLRPPAPVDVPALVEAVRSSLQALSPWMPWAGDAYGEASASGWIAESVAAGDHPFIVLDAAHRLVGVCGLNRIDGINRCANLGYWTRTSQTGFGYATRAARLVADFGHSVGIHRVEILAAIENSASCRVAQSAGAHFEGIARGRLLLHGRFHDAKVYSLLAG